MFLSCWARYSIMWLCYKSWRMIFRGKKRLLNTPALSYLYLVFLGRSSTSPCLTLNLLGIQLFLYVLNLTEQTTANHTSKWRLQDALRLRDFLCCGKNMLMLTYFFHNKESHIVSTRSYRFVNIRLARTEYDDESQRLQETSYNI